VIIQELEAGAAYTATVSAFNKKGTSLVRHILIETLQPPESQLVEEKLAHQAGGGDGGGGGGGDLGWQLGGGVLAGVILSLVLITGRRAWRGLAGDGLIDLRVDRTTSYFSLMAPRNNGEVTDRGGGGGGEVGEEVGGGGGRRGRSEAGGMVWVG
jgi:hypothetical protein